jgi:hypothetical protein
VNYETDADFVLARGPVIVEGLQMPSVNGGSYPPPQSEQAPLDAIADSLEGSAARIREAMRTEVPEVLPEPEPVVLLDLTATEPDEPPVGAGDVILRRLSAQGRAALTEAIAEHLDAHVGGRDGTIRTAARWLRIIAARDRKS